MADKKKPNPVSAVASATEGHGDLISDLKAWTLIEVLKFGAKRLFAGFFKTHQEVAASRIGHMFLGPPKEAISIHERAETKLFGQEKIASDLELASRSKRFTHRLAPPQMPRELSNLYRAYFAVMPVGDKPTEQQIDDAIEATAKIIDRHSRMDDDQWHDFLGSYDLDRSVVPDPVLIGNDLDGDKRRLEVHGRVLNWILAGTAVIFVLFLGAVFFGLAIAGVLINTSVGR
jgi:hypothetical protein